MKTLMTLGMLVAAVAASAGAADAGSPACEHKLLPGDRNEFTCAVPATSKAQRMRFVAKLSGSHDDSSSTLALAWGGAPLPCEDGSKVESDGEYGDVVMECRFTLPATNGAQPKPLLASLKATHVFVTSHALTAD
ncbi:hypothetical protein [Aquabacterium sp.]|uniref:hypothetical protein n=1 Tax=Aquabacterium sp. TaxID=1872578 RepID=UPI0035B08793